LKKKNKRKWEKFCCFAKKEKKWLVENSLFAFSLKKIKLIPFSFFKTQKFNFLQGLNNNIQVFRQKYNCYSVAFKGKEELENGDKSKRKH